jgi:hypothetical protein
MGAVGPSHIVEMINGNFEVFDKTGVSLSSVDLYSFWSSVGVPVLNGDSFDTRIVFDPASGRFFASSIDRDFGTGNHIYLARSDSSDATGDWDGVRFAADSEGPSSDFDTRSTPTATSARMILRVPNRPAGSPATRSRRPICCSPHPRSRT